MHSIVTTFRGADIKVKVANFCAAMDTLIDQDDNIHNEQPADCKDNINAWYGCPKVSCISY